MLDFASYPDILWKEEPQRTYRDKREEVFQLFKKILDQFEFKYGKLAELELELELELNVLVGVLFLILGKINL